MDHFPFGIFQKQIALKITCKTGLPKITCKTSIPKITCKTDLPKVQEIELGRFFSFVGWLVRSLLVKSIKKWNHFCSLVTNKEFVE